MLRLFEADRPLIIDSGLNDVVGGELDVVIGRGFDVAAICLKS